MYFGPNKQCVERTIVELVQRWCTFNL